jgi:hypothetical protein
MPFLVRWHGAVSGKIAQFPVSSFIRLTDHS